MTRLTRRCLLRSRLLRFAIVLFAVWSTVDVLLVRSNIRAASIETTKIRAPSAAKIYIASVHWNNGEILRSHWNAAVIKLVKALGQENVYISIHESGSWDDSKGALRVFDEQLELLKVRKTITLDPTTHKDEIEKAPGPSGWIETPRGKTELRRIPYLSRLRNLTLKPLEEMAEKGEHFDKILFLNDVVFSTQDVLALLATNNGEYAAACSLDFQKPPNYYDTFALRDSDGYEHVLQTWPYFRSRKSRQAMKRSAPVPVASCWNGMVIMDASPFYSTPSSPSRSPLRFRGTPTSLSLYHLEASECCLIHADNPLTHPLNNGNTKEKVKGVFLNPNVRVGYNGPAYDTVHKQDGWLSTSEIFYGLWTNRFKRWTTTTWLKWFFIAHRLSQWKKAEEKSEKRDEPGDFCLINEMQVLVWNGWAHV